jgi:hypothetical protein
MNGKIVPVQIRLPVELVNTIGEYLQEKRNSSSADFVIQKTMPTIERNSLVHNINEICAEVPDENGKANGILQKAGTVNIKRDTCRIMTEMIPISPLLSVAPITFAFSLGKIS